MNNSRKDLEPRQGETDRDFQEPLRALRGQVDSDYGGLLGLSRVPRLLWGGLWGIFA